MGSLAIVFGPIFFGQSEISDPAQLVTETNIINKLTGSLIEHYPLIFTNESVRPAQLLRVQESVNQTDFALLKGETLLYFQTGTSSHIQISGKICSVSRDEILSRCEPLRFPALPPVKDSELIASVRAEAIRKYSTFHKEPQKSGPSPRKFIPVEPTRGKSE